MKYINHFSKEGYVNLLADYIIKSINPIHKSRFQVVDFKSFLVVYGSTSSDEVLDLNRIRDSFMENNPDLVSFLNLKNINIIDLVDYREPLSSTEFHFEYYNTERPIFHQKVINEINRDTNQDYNKEFLNNINFTDKLELEFYSPFIPENLNIFNSTNFLSTSSSFPYGHSLNLGRREFYYGEYICNQLFEILGTDKIILKYSSEIDSEDDFKIDVICDSLYSNDKIKSLILDVFDFNLSKFSIEYLKDYEIENDIKNQMGDKPWLVKDKVKDLVIF